VECDPSIKSIIVKIDSEDHAFIIEELDDQTLVVKETMVPLLKQRLEEVSMDESKHCGNADPGTQILTRTLEKPQLSGSE
jgi:hypothetical protein